MKIFVTVGSLFPFDRLVVEVDEWCANRDELKVTAQIGNSDYTPRHMEYHQVLESSDFNRIFIKSDLIIAHAGTGIILKALVGKKALLVMPRRVAYNEVTTDHQLATAKVLEESAGLNVAWDNEQFRASLNNIKLIKPGKKIGDFASGELIAGIRKFIDEA